MEIISFKKVGNISFGETRVQVRKLYPDFREFRKTPMSVNSTDAYPNFHVFYNRDNKVEAIEFFKGSVLTIGNVNLFSVNKDTLINNFNDYVDKGDALDFPKEGFIVSFENGVVADVLVYCKGYWD